MEFVNDSTKRNKMGNTVDTAADATNESKQFTRLKEFSVVYTGAALNLMSQEFQHCMRDISACLKSCCKLFD